MEPERIPTTSLKTMSAELEAIEIAAARDFRWVLVRSA